MRHSVTFCWIVVILAGCCLGSAAWALDLPLSPVIVASICDEPRDGAGDVINDVVFSGVVSENATRECRAIQEFDLRDLADVTIDSATISGRIEVNNSLDVGERLFDFLLYEGNGGLDLADFEIPAVSIGSGSYAPPDDSSFDFSFDVTTAIQGLISDGASHVGFKADCASDPNATNILLSAPIAQLFLVIPDPDCGNGLLEPGEECDDSNNNPGDGCDSSCNLEGTCGDGVVNAGEQCDDGNNTSSDGCDLDCTASLQVVGKVYFGMRRFGTPAFSNISRINSDGSGQQVLREDTSPDAIVIDPASKKMYWIDGDGIQRANLNGSNLETVLATDRALDLEIDLLADKLYWTKTSGDSIQRVNLDGTNVEVVVDGLDDPAAIALHIPGGKIYWVENGPNLVRRANLNGSDVQSLVQIQALGGGGPLEIDPVSNKMYWVDNGLRRANLDASHIELVAGVNAGSIAIVPGDQIYWIRNQQGGGGGSDSIFRANLDGSSAQEIFESSEAGLSGLALLDESLVDETDVPATSGFGLLALALTMLATSTLMACRPR